MATTPTQSPDKGPLNAGKSTITRKKRSKYDTQKQISSQNGTHGLASIVLFCLILASLGLFYFFQDLQKIEIVVRLGLANSIYYIVICVLGISVAGFLYGILPSSGTWEGNIYGGRLKLGGAAVGFALVLIGGYVFRPSVNFSAAIYVHGEKGKNDLVLTSKGLVVLDVGHRRPGKIDDKGQAYFTGLPANFRGQKVVVSLTGAGFEPVEEMIVLSEEVYLAVRPKPCAISGTVQDENGNPVPHAEVHIGTITTTTDNMGHFSLLLTGDLSVKAELPASINASGFKIWNGAVVPQGNTPTIMLRRVF